MIILSGILIFITVFIFSALKVGSDYDRSTGKYIKGETDDKSI
jgi:hypothetical protein